MPFPLIAALVGAGASLIGARQGARASREAAGIEAEAARQNRNEARRTTDASLSDFDAALNAALGHLSGGAGAADQGYATAAGYQQPFADAGGRGLSDLTAALGLDGADAAAGALSRFQTGPGYTFAMGEGVDALDRSAAARGGLYSGGAARELTAFGQGLANQEWGNHLSRLAGLAGSGQAAAGTLSNLAVGRGTAAGGFAGATADALLGAAGNRANIRNAGLSAITGANTATGAANAGGVVGAANAWNGGLTNLTTLLGTAAGEGFSTPLMDMWRARNAAAAPAL
jgi:hypothetical protein